MKTLAQVNGIVLPMGSSDVPGVLLGYPTLDDYPRGLGWYRREYTHYFAAVNVHLPRAELKSRAQHLREVASWRDEGLLNDPDGLKEGKRGKKLQETKIKRRGGGAI